MKNQLAGFLMVFVLICTGCRGDSEPQRATSLTPPAMSVAMTREECPSMEVQAGMQVSWTNEDTIILPIRIEQLSDSNEVVVTGGSEIGPGDEFSTVFVEPGTYQVYCSENEQVFGTITVR